MKTGEVVRDPQGRSFQVGQMLGRGLWGKTFAAVEEGAGEWVIKAPLTAAELREGVRRDPDGAGPPDAAERGARIGAL